jgi:hypothetical protein
MSAHHRRVNLAKDMGCGKSGYRTPSAAQGNKLLYAKVISIHPGVREARNRNFPPANAINILTFEVDKNQMLGEGSTYSGRMDAKGTLMQFLSLALELLRRCGMILRVRTRPLLEDGLVHLSLRSRVHYSLVIFCNGLNLSGGSYV